VTNSEKLHREISYLKSGIRFIGYALLPFHLMSAAIVLAVAELVGVLEEAVL
jgi:hypothetical protein